MNDELTAWAAKCEAAFNASFSVEYDRDEDEHPNEERGDVDAVAARIKRVSELAAQHVAATIPADCAHCEAAPLDHYDLAQGHEWGAK